MHTLNQRRRAVANPNQRNTDFFVVHSQESS
jgi:hypothetical protein